MKDQPYIQMGIWQAEPAATRSIIFCGQEAGGSVTVEIICTANGIYRSVYLYRYRADSLMSE